MNIRIALGLAVLALALGGCVTPPQTPIQMSDSTLAPANGRIGVAMTELPKVDTHLPGAGCLLCIAVASAANKDLTTHTQTLSYEDLPKLKDSMAALLRKKGLSVTVIPENLKLDQLSDYANAGPNVARKDFTQLQRKYNVDKLLVIAVAQLGMERTYSAYVPTSDPKGVFRGAGYIVNLKSNAYEWYMPVNIMRSAEGAWDEPPKFPGLTNAYYQALETGKDTFLKPFGK